MTIILDAMGSDDHPGPEIEGALQFVRDFGEDIILVGNEGMLSPRLAGQPGHEKMRVVHAPDVLEMTDKPVEGTRKKPLNSMAVGLGLLKKGEGSAFVSAGNTGGVLFNALRTLGRVKGVQRPALFPVLPTRTGRAILVDSGANSDCRPEFLLEFALMGSVYSEKVMNVARPRIGLLSNGEEDEKGNELVKAAHPLLAASPLNFVGNVEPKEVYQGMVDVVVTDGFTGNVFLKTSEAVGKLMLDTLRTELQSRFLYKVGAGLSMPAFRKVRAMLNPEDIGAAILLGVDGLVFVGHGHSNARAIYSAVRFARQVVNANLLDTLRDTIQTAFTHLPTGEKPA